ncbi:MAG: hypothetical protein AMJ64_14045 [Betaproteobacteria bacterium SG8_39]|nr:MAG: hypothetical protein AMJ64_14045 [Betaproteobacteria bacterium SG8_39]
MANGGWTGTKAAWERIEGPLLEIDPIIAAFAKEHALSVSRNHKDWPERSVVWGDDVRCLIQLYLADAASLTFNLWLCASRDRGGKRYWKQETPIKGMRVPDFKHDLAAQLRTGRIKLLEWAMNEGQLEPAARSGR